MDGEVDVLVVTPLGSISVRVFLARAPVTGGAFLACVDEKQFASAAFYRTVRPDNDCNPHPIQVVQGGVIDLSDSKGLAHEPTNLTGLRHADGAVSAARRELGTGTAASFFVCIGAQPALDFGGARHSDGQGYAVFGCVTSGMDVVRRIHALPTAANAPHPLLAGQMLAARVPFLSVARVAE